MMMSLRAAGARCPLGRYPLALRPFHSSGPACQDPNMPPPAGSEWKDVQSGPPQGWERRFGGTTAFPDVIEHWSRKSFYRVGGVASALVGGAAFAMGPMDPMVWAAAAPVAAYWLVGLRDINSRHTIRRNFPILGNVRYMLESIRPEIRQYFIEGDYENLPFSRVQRSLVYQRAKGFKDSQPFGTRLNVYEPGYEYMLHSMWPKTVTAEDMRVVIGGPDCTQPYSASVYNVSAMSFGAISANAVRALTQAAKFGDFWVNTGEGGVSAFHLEAGCDIVWNIGTGYFGCRTPEGTFSAEKFKATAGLPQIKMVEIKLSQGAKPAHGGILPKDKLTPAIAAARGVPMGEDCNSPPTHSAFSSAEGLMGFIKKLRELSGGKPVGFKLCMGHRDEFVALARAMRDTGITPDFITVDGGEGGTGAAPPEFSNHIGMPLTEALIFADQTLEAAGLRDRVKIVCSGKVISGMALTKALAKGADVCNSARAMMLALGCIQALKCNTNKCPTGIATQDEDLAEGLVVPDKAMRVFRYHRRTVSTAAEILGAMGLSSGSEISRKHLLLRVSPHEVKSLDDIYPPPPMSF